MDAGRRRIARGAFARGRSALQLGIAVLAVAAACAGGEAMRPAPAAPAASAEPSAVAASAPTWGVAGPLGTPYRALREAGVAVTILELAWRDAEPAAGVWNEGYFRAQRSELARLREAGIAVVLNTGMHEPPPWALDQPGARYVDQYGQVSGDQAGLNLVWNHALRPVAAEYLAKVFAELGTDFAYVRTGGGELGELTYPRSSGTTGSYWAFDAAAAGVNPVPGWRPGGPSGGDESAVFLDWYLGALAEFQNWQVHTVRQHFAGPIAVLYPDVGLQPAELAAAAAGGLAGTSPAELSRRVQTGQDHERMVAALDDAGAVAWCTWANNGYAVASIAEPARRRGLPVVGENSGDETSLADLDALAGNAHTFDLHVVIWVRYTDLVAGAPGVASFADFTRISGG
jgi:hypothetical protein